MLIENADYFVRLIPFPPGDIDGAVMPNDDGTFSIYLDSNSDDAHRRVALDHELNHITMDHFYVDKPLDVIEKEADTGIVEEKGLTLSDLDAKAENYLNGWRRAIEWAIQMQEKYGDSDDVPEYKA